MTTIIATRKAIYADTKCSYAVSFRTTKIVRIGDSLFGGAGDMEHIVQFFAWKSGGTKPEYPDDASFDVLEVSKHGILAYGKHLVALPVIEKFYAIGSGSQFATGALAMGATPQEALKVAAKYDSSTSGPFEELTL